MQRIHDRDVPSRKVLQEVHRQGEKVMHMSNIRTDKVKEFGKGSRNRRILVALGKAASLLPTINDSPENETLEDTIPDTV